MAKTKSKPLPKYRRQTRPSGNHVAFVELGGRRVYLGPHNSPESREAFGRLLAEWESTGGNLSAAPEAITVAELVAQFWKHAETFYRRPDGTPTSELTTYKYAVRPMVELYAGIRVSEFGPKSLKTVRTRMIGLGWCRSHINKSVSRLRSVFRWGTENELVPPSILHALQSVKGLARGRSDARESLPRLPVPVADIQAVREHVPKQVWALIQLQLCTGARSGELVGLRALDIDTTGDVWTHRPDWHKTACHGHTRTIYFGPQAQNILRPFLANRPVDRSLFSPREAERERHNGAQTHRRADQRPNPKSTDRVIGDAYDSGSYRRCITRACREAKIPTWSPHRLRHNAASQLRSAFGLDVAQTILGHRIGSRITKLYAAENESKALDAIRAAG